jgi:hypothetical protein
MPDFSTDIEIEPWEYISECNRREIDELIESLIENGHLSEFNGKVTSKKEGVSIMDLEWDESLMKIRNSRHLLSNEDEHLIIEISKKLI